jgi:signal transduction histidine kinase
MPKLRESKESLVAINQEQRSSQLHANDHSSAIGSGRSADERLFDALLAKATKENGVPNLAKLRDSVCHTLQENRRTNNRLERCISAMSAEMTELNKQTSDNARSTMLALVTASREALLLLNCDLNIVFVNKKAVELIGAPNVASLIGRASSDFFAFSEIGTSGVSFLSGRKLDGSEIKLSITLSSGAFDGVDYHVLSMRDETERAQRDAMLQAALTAAEEANAAKSLFLANVSHELRTPLNSIIGHAELIEEDLSPTDFTQPLLDVQKIQAAAQHLLSLINHLLDIAKIESGHLELLPIETDMDSWMEQMVSLSGTLATANGNAIVFEPISLGHWLIDETKLRQCLFNLVANACKFTTSGTVTLLASADGNSLRFEVRDTGVGIAPEETDRIFRPFSQANSSVAKRFGGTGLGLVITRQLAQLMGGDLTFTSVLGKGSSFILSVQGKRL